MHYPGIPVGAFVGGGVMSYTRSTGADPTTDSMTIGWVKKSEARDKNPEKREGKIWVSSTSPTRRNTSRLVSI